MSDAVERWITRFLLAAGVVGFVVSFPLWLLGAIGDHAMLGVTLVLSWAALWYAAFLAIQNARQTRELGNRLDALARLLGVPPPGSCALPPKGWFCSLDVGHAGSCPTWPA